MVTVREEGCFRATSLPTLMSHQAITLSTRTAPTLLLWERRKIFPMFASIRRVFCYLWLNSFQTDTGAFQITLKQPAQGDMGRESCAKGRNSLCRPCLPADHGEDSCRTMACRERGVRCGRPVKPDAFHRKRRDTRGLECSMKKFVKSQEALEDTTFCLFLFPLEFITF